MTSRAIGRAHAHARERGVSRGWYAFARAVLTPLVRGWFSVVVEGADNVPETGPAIIAPNHKSFMDVFFVGLSTRRHVRFMAKEELFRWPLAWLLVRLGAFPVRRGEHDEEALETARVILAGGDVVVVFPEGTRVPDPDVLGAPHHGAGRLAIETGAPIVPTAIAGTARLWFGPFPKPRRVLVAFRPPLYPPHPPTPDAVSDLVDRQLWPEVREEYGRLRATPGVIISVLATLGLGTGLITRRQAPPRVVGVVEPLKFRRRAARARFLDRLRSLWRR
ncbi:MAG TPA: lysophospholipid acyltransferase family protein [Solirubrobacter sp.]|jgi:1-acyl-sn-glycerol-3-phosphate acyltransferase|nr:lysophospholipid acyltransferase family protein [Solirubrobacter sp.]